MLTERDPTAPLLPKPEHPEVLESQIVAARESQES